MRIIHQIGPKRTIQMTCGGHAYHGPVGHEHEWRGWHCELLITPRDELTGYEQPIEIEGKGSDVIHALTSALEILANYERVLREQHVKRTAKEERNAND